MTSRTTDSNKQFEVLEEKYTQLQSRVAHVQASNSNLRDEVVALKRNYQSLVEGLNKRFETIAENFRK